jgi:hypothetical protein
MGTSYSLFIMLSNNTLVAMEMETNVFALLLLRHNLVLYVIPQGLYTRNRMRCSNAHYTQII